METINWKIEGMSCANCVLAIHQYLEKQGLQHVRVSMVSGEVSFDKEGTIDAGDISKGITGLGYTVITDPDASSERKPINKFLRYTLICLPFTVLLLAPMLLRGDSFHFLMNPWVQLVFCLPVYGLGMGFFGRSAVRSLLNGLPNMNVLVTIGASAAFFYSLTGTLFRLGPDYQFYETAASIIMLVFLGNYLEEASVQSTQKALKTLSRSQKVMANMIAFDGDHQEQIFPVGSDQLRSGDLILIRTGEQVPADCKILWGEAGVNEAILSGESLPLDKGPKDRLVGGSLLVSGIVKAQVTASAKESVLAGIINLVKQAQGEKPPIQQLVDKISAIFVPIVLGLALLTGLLNYVILQDLTAALMRSIAVLVIACPCAMGLATPAAIAVGLGRAARQGMLFRHARSLESFKNIRQIVFDKTGTLTTGAFRIEGWYSTELSEGEFKRICYSIEKYSGHPIAKCITKEWKQGGEQRWAKIEEIRGLGMRAETKTGDCYQMGSYKLAAAYTRDDTHNSYLVLNDRLVGWIDLADEERPEARETVAYFKRKGIRTILLSGDRPAACIILAERLGIEEVYAGQSPLQKMEKVEELNARAPVAMIGDGINDAPALAKATVGVSMSDASQLAMQTSDLVLMNQGLRNLPAALSLGRQTFSTIRQNLFWAFFYNIVAIPVAATGLLSPSVAALVMGLSDVVLAFNSLRLFVKKPD